MKSLLALRRNVPSIVPSAVGVPLLPLVSKPRTNTPTSESASAVSPLNVLPFEFDPVNATSPLPPVPAGLTVAVDVILIRPVLPTLKFASDQVVWRSEFETDCIEEAF